LSRLEECKEPPKGKMYPLLMYALAKFVEETMLKQKLCPQKAYEALFGDGTMTIRAPASKMVPIDPLYHSFVGQKLLYVDWELRFPGIQLPCPNSNCNGRLKKDRTNFSKNKVLFPIFALDGPPSWAIVMKYKCPCCNQCTQGNSGELLSMLPPHVAALYPVEPKYALPTATSHLNKNVTVPMELLMPTYANGVVVAKMIYNGITTNYAERMASYFSECKQDGATEESNTTAYPKLVGEFMTRFPPTAETIRTMYYESEASSNNFWKLAENKRHMCEIQSVKCETSFAGRG
jgi:hypothetical protein